MAVEIIGNFAANVPPNRSSFGIGHFTSSSSGTSGEEGARRLLEVQFAQPVAPRGTSPCGETAHGDRPPACDQEIGKFPRARGNLLGQGGMLRSARNSSR